MRVTREDMKLFAASFVVTVGLIVGGCAVQQRMYRGPDEPRPKTPRITPGVSIQMSSLDRMEFYVGGLHVGTMFFDGTGGVFVGTDSQGAAKIIAELLTQLEMLRGYMQRDQGDTYY